MDEEDWIGHWEAFYSSVVVENADMRIRQTPTVDHLNRLEAVLGIRLPLSYRAFVRAIGPGRIQGSFTVRAPGYRGATVVDFLAANKWQEEEAEERSSPEQVRRLVAFGDILDQYFVWDTGGGQQDGSEFPIMWVPKRYEDSLIEVTSSFQSFVEDCCIGGSFWPLIGASDASSWEDWDGNLRSDPCFEPIGDRPTSSI